MTESDSSQDPDAGGDWANPRDNGGDRAGARRADGDSADADDRHSTIDLDWAELANWLVAGIVVAILGAYAYKFVYPGGASSLVGQKAPPFQKRRAQGDGTLSLDDFRGDTVLLDFWATWCPPCHEQMRYLKKLPDHPDAPDDVSVVLVNTDRPGPDRLTKVRGYLRRRRVPFPSVLDDGSIQRRYGVSSFPTLVLVTPDGTVRFAEPGVHPTSELLDLLHRHSPD